MVGLVRRWRSSTATIAFATVAAAILSACTIQLAPAPDKALSDGIKGLNNDIMTLYATAGMAATRDSFPQRADRYNKIIGTADALALQSQSRPVPDSAIRDKVENALHARFVSDPQPSAAATSAMKMAADECADALHVPRTPAIPPVAPVPADTQQYIPASAMALTQVSRAIAFLRDTDCAHGLNSGRVAVNKGEVQHFISEALFYEYMLQR
ncbi:hypothetical protein [Paraburkholderia diazotrophica]|uniref:Lipoprotein n=1 Tax=Paraburkholderia diazotrophica TaxID=667676 RepID=A0A1H7DW35_9BURK|nr:hypothetical protein [Paraburkholderia diazotrophica]SEK02515.1 hypothetical protein SAMN05192539_103177 [Paraburkholderia diazotrophica]